MEIKNRFGIASMIAASAAAAAGCAAGDARPGIAAATGEASAHITMAVAIPADATCTHVIATRLSDFAVTDYQGVLLGGTFAVLPGDTEVTATAFPEPCDSEPASPPWIADEQVATFTGGDNTLMLHFRDAASVVLDPTFDDGAPRSLVLRPGSPFQLGRNGEDAAAPNYSLDGWTIKRIALPPSAPSETVVFSTRGKGGLTQSPRGLAALPDGTFVVQESDSHDSLRQFSAAGDFLEAWPVVYPPGATPFDNTDGLEAIDATHLVRTGQLNNPINCDGSGDHCTQSGLDILELVTLVDGSHELHVARQLFLPELAGQTLNLDYPVGVTPVGTGFAVASIPNDGSPQVLTLLDASGAVVAGPTPMTGDVEGLFIAADGRLGALAYDGALTMRDPATLAPRTGETSVYHTGIDLAIPTSLAWNSGAGSFLALTQDNRLVTFSPALTGASDVGIDMSAFVLAAGLDYRADTNQVLIADRVPPVDATTGLRIPTVDSYDLATLTRASTVTLQGISQPARTISIAYVPGRQQIAGIYHRPGGARDPAVDAVVVTSNSDGTLAGSFDLAPFGFHVAQAISYLPATDELVITAPDASGAERLVVTSPTGHPRRSYRLDAIGDVIDVAPITSGPSAGDLGAVENQPSNYFQLSLQ